MCTASLESASVAVETPSVVVQEEFDILLGVGGTCMVDQGGPQGGGFGAPVGPSWHHSVAFGDGGSATAAGAPATTEHSYASAGTYEISGDVTCSPCQSVFVLGTAKTTVSVGSGCSAANMDTTARAELGSYHREAFERGFTMLCSDSNVQIRYKRNSEGKDPCRVHLGTTAAANRLWALASLLYSPSTAQRRFRVLRKKELGTRRRKDEE